MTGFNSKRQWLADKLQETVEFDTFLESQDFYELMQTYRHCQIDAHIPFEAVKDALRAVHTEAASAQPAQEIEQSKIFCGVDYADGVLAVSVMRRSPDGVAELLHSEQIELAQPAQEPVAVVDANDDGYWADILPNRNVKVGQLLYTTPPKREWVGLTDEDYVEMGLSLSLIEWQHKAIEAKLKEKNG
jgi:hypothetical protein